MKKMIATLVAAALIVPTAAHARELQVAPPHRTEQAQSQPEKTAKVTRTSTKSKNWKKGERFSRSQAPNYARVNHANYRALKAAPHGYVWVRSGRDAVLVRLSNNIVAQVVTGVFG